MQYIWVSYSHNLLLFQNDLYKRGLKAKFKISKWFGDMHQNVDTMLHLFDHTVKSVLAANNVVVVCKSYFINTLKQSVALLRHMNIICLMRGVSLVDIDAI